MSHITSHNLKACQRLINVCWRYVGPNFAKITLDYCTSKDETPPKRLFRYLIRQCDKLPEGPKEHYKFMIKQSFKQYAKESDPERIKQIVARSYEDADWVLKKYLDKKK